MNTADLSSDSLTLSDSYSESLSVEIGDSFLNLTETGEPVLVTPYLTPNSIPTPTMSYTDWTPTHASISVRRFVPYESLLRLLMENQYLNFSIHDQRSQFITGIRTVQAAPGITRTSRFPEGVILVDTSSGVVANLLRRLASLLDFGEKTLELQGSSSSSYADSKLAFVKTLGQLLEILQRDPANASSDGIFTQDSFEKYFSLHWGN